jgi:carboxyl-terminal processing protease
MLVAAVISAACYSEAEHRRYVSILGEAMDLIESNALEKVEDRTLFEGAMDGMVASLGDQYSNYISPTDFAQFQEGLDQEFGGVGIVVEVHPETKLLTVMSPLVNTPAYEAGLQAGDVILKIDGQSTRDLEMTEAVKLMRGKPGEEIRLTIHRDEEETPREFVLRRAIIPVESVLGDTRGPNGEWNYFLEENPQIGYIRLTTFGDRTAQEMEQALAQYKTHPVDAVILDMRDNAGGYLSAAVAVSDMFLEEGRIVSTRGRKGEVRTAYDAASKTLFPQDKPMVVLVNTYTASASEIVAACLQDHGRAVVVGVRTWGKGTVQNVIELEGGQSALKLTTASYWRPSGKNIHRLKDAGENGDWGVKPNEGLDVALDDEAAEKLHRLRRLRDIVLRPGQTRPTFASTDDSNREVSSPASDPADPDVVLAKAAQEDSKKSDQPSDQAAHIHKWSDDPQLRRAVEYLQEQAPPKELAVRKE